MLPIPVIISFFTNFGAIKKIFKLYWKEIIVVSMAGMLWYQNFSETRFLFFLETIPSLEQRLEVVNANLDTCAEGNKTLTDTIEKRNDEIQEWKVLSDILQKQNDELSKDIADDKEVAEKEVVEILAKETPKSCSEAIQLLRDDVENIKW